MSATAAVDAGVGSGVRRVRMLSLTYLDAAFTNAQQVNAREVISRLDTQRFEVTAFASGPIDRRLAGKPGLHVVRLGPHWRALRMLRVMLGRFDIIWYPHPGPAEIVYLRLLRPWLGVHRRPLLLLPIEADLRQLDEVPPALRRRALFLMRSVDAVFPISQHVANLLRERLGRSGPIVPIGVDTSVFRPRGSGDSTGAPVRVVTVGTLSRRKRPGLVVEAARRLADVEFVLVGDGPLRKSLEGDLPPNVRLTGPLAQRGVVERCREADILLHPGLLEGMPKAVLEGMACGLPPVLFDSYGPDFVTNGEEGFVVKTEAEMFRALECLAANPRLRAAMGAKARKKVEQYDWDRVSALWENIFESARSTLKTGGHEP